MATRSTDELLSKVLRLPVDERARVAQVLIASLDEGPADEGAEQAWSGEIEKRARDVLAGKSVVVETGEMFRRLRNELSSVRREAAPNTRSGRGRSQKGRPMVRAKGTRPR
jgi:putative addiction module component (TIGR02574 family)